MLAFVVVLAGCVVSIEPAVPESEATFDARLVGSWENGSERAVIARAGASGYAIEYTTAKGDSGRFQGRIGRLGERLVLELRPVPREREVREPYDGLFVAGHLLLALDVGADELRIALLRPDSLLAALTSGGVRASHSRADERVILRGTSAELRAALAAYAARAGAWGEPDVWRRVKPPSR